MAPSTTKPQPRRAIGALLTCLPPLPFLSAAMAPKRRHASEATPPVATPETSDVSEVASEPTSDGTSVSLPTLHSVPGESPEHLLSRRSSPTQSPTSPCTRTAVSDDSHTIATSDESDDGSVCRHTSLRFLEIDWPEPYVGRQLATNSLRHVDNLDTRFRGPIPATVLLELSDRNSVGSVLNSQDYAVPGQLAIDGTVTVTDFVMQGRIWSGFSATANVHGSPATLVAKFTTPKEHPICTDDVVDEVGRESWLYENNLAPLQGMVVPTSYGVYYAWQASHQGQSTSEVLCSVLEHAGQPLTPDDVAELPESDKEIIVTKYRQLHAAGVVHVSANPKHWLLKPGAPFSTLKFIDFGTSLLRPDRPVLDAGLHVWNELTYTTEEWLEAAEAEIIDVERILGLLSEDEVEDDAHLVHWVAHQALGPADGTSP